uniref:Uncharacterized protein n=1 Tax=Oncorhynchus kisutch TaxID=8019 RepID=A0A8C7FMK0_ONCKI
MVIDKVNNMDVIIAYNVLEEDLQSFPDNYVDRRFMEELRGNEGFHLYRCWAVVREAGLVAQHLLCGSVPHLLVVHGAGTNSDCHQCTRWSDVKSASIFTFGFSPVLRSLRVCQYRHAHSPSLNAALFASICLASPFPTSWGLDSSPSSLHTFSMLCWAQLIKLQSDKDNIQGHWDEAEIREDLTHFLH